MNGSYCSAQVISSTALLTAAHCMPADGYYRTQVEQQRVAGAAPYVLFSGYTWIYFSRHSGYWGTGNYSLQDGASAILASRYPWSSEIPA
jgi:hypothetical protein